MSQIIVNYKIKRRKLKFSNGIVQDQFCKQNCLLVIRQGSGSILISYFLSKIIRKQIFLLHERFYTLDGLQQVMYTISRQGIYVPLINVYWLCNIFYQYLV